MAKSSKKAPSKVKSTVNPVKNDSLVIDVEVLMVPLSILLAGLMVSISIIVGLKGLQESGISTTTGATETTTTTATQTETADTGTEDYTNDGAYDGTVTVSIDDDPYLGDKDSAKIVIVEYVDYECYYCKRHFDETADAIKEKYIDSGDAILVIKDAPSTDLHGSIVLSQSEAAQCVLELGGNETYFKYHDLLFENSNSDGQFPEASLYTYAEQVGVDANTFASCYDSGRYADEVLSDLEDAQTAGIFGTPGFVIGVLESDGSVTGTILSGAYPYADFETVIEKALGN